MGGGEGREGDGERGAFQQFRVTLRRDVAAAAAAAAVERV